MATYDPNCSRSYRLKLLTNLDAPMYFYHLPRGRKVVKIAVFRLCGVEKNVVTINKMIILENI